MPPLGVLAAGVLALVSLGTAALPVLALLLAGSLWFLVRTVAYSYRVFAFAVPVLTYAMALLTAGLLAFATLVAGARFVGRGEPVDSVITALAARTDTPALLTLVGGTVDLAGVAVPALPATLIGVPVALGMAYVVVQLAASLVARLVKPTTRRPELRSGQRYPEFARPTTTVTTSDAPSPARSTSAASTDGEGAQTEDRKTGADQSTEGATEADTDGAPTDATDAEPDLSNTRVFTAGDDAPSVSPAAVDSADVCQACGAELDPEAPGGLCPECGADR